MKILLGYKKWNHIDEDWPKKPHEFSEEYRIEISRPDGVGVTDIEAKTVLHAFLGTTFDDAKKNKKHPC